MTFTTDFSPLSREQLIERVVELELMLFSKGEQMELLPFHLPEKEKLILDALYRAKGRRLDHDFLQQSSGTKSWSSTKVHISKLRARLRLLGMSIENSLGQGYWLGPDTLKHLESLIVAGPKEVLSHSLSAHGRASLVHSHSYRETGAISGRFTTDGSHIEEVEKEKS